MGKVAILAALVASLGISACAQQETATAPANAEIAPAKVEALLTTQGVLDGFKVAGLPVQDLHVYTAENDPNALLGRPGQYTGKANWNDGRHPADDPDGANTVEVFSDADSMAKRRDYIIRVTGDSPMLLQYIHAHKNALVRLDKQITPDQAMEYQRALEAL